MAVLQKLRKSLTARLFVVYLVTAVLLLAIILVTLLTGFARQWQFNARPHIEQYLDFVSEEIGNPPSEAKATALAERLPVNIYIVGPDTQFATNGALVDFDDEVFEDARRGFRRRHQSIGDGKIQFSGDEERTLLKSTVGEYRVYYELIHNQNRQHRRGILLPALLGVLAAISGCFLIIRRLLKPVRDIKLGVKQMGQGDLSYRIPVRNNNDLGELASSINTMSSDIDKMLEAKRQLLLGASHELRSPLTRAKVAVQLLDDSKARGLLEDDLSEMEALIADILESERMKSGHAQLDRSSFDIRELVESVLLEMQATDIPVKSADNLPLLYADELRLKLLLRNLIGNAIKHTDIENEESAHGTDESPRSDPNPALAIGIAIDKEHCIIDVVDSGPGIAPEHIDKVTEPFYRTDASRSRSTGGFGLGLHLAKLIAEAHGGSLHVDSISDKEKDQRVQRRTVAGIGSSAVGTTATIKLPLITPG